MRTVRGRVVHGEGLGRRLGFPTANINISPRSRPPSGVWRVWVMSTLFSQRLAVCNVGIRPTLGGTKRIVEVHIPGYQADLYGRTLTIQFIAAIRPERRFHSLSALKAQIQADVESLTSAPLQVRMNS